MQENESKFQDIITRLKNNDHTLIELNIVFNYSYEEIKEIIKAIRNNYNIEALQIRNISNILILIELLESLCINHTLTSLCIVEYNDICYKYHIMITSAVNINKKIHQEGSTIQNNLLTTALIIKAFFGPVLPYQLIGTSSKTCTSILDFYLRDYKKNIMDNNFLARGSEK